MFGGFVMVMASSYFDIFTSLIQAILVARLLGPTGRGLMTLPDIFNQWLSNSHLGSLHGLSKMLPMTLARHEEARAEEMEDIGAITITGLGILAGLGMLGYALFGTRPQLLTRGVLACGAGVVICCQTAVVYRTILRAWGTFSVVALAAVVFNATQFVLVIAGAWRFGVVGAMIGLLLAQMAQLGYYHSASGLRVRLRWNWGIARYLITSGLPLWITVFADTAILRTVDRILIIRFFGVYYVGLYYIASQLSRIINRIPESLGLVLMPRIWEGYARDGMEAIRRQILLPTLAVATLMPGLGGVLFVSLPYLLQLLVPQYVQGTFAAQVMALGAAFLALPIAANGLLVAVNRESTVTVAKLAGAAVVCLGAYWLRHRSGLNLTAVAVLNRMAIITAVGYLVASLLQLIPAFIHYHPRPAALVRQLLILHLPIPWAVGAIWLAGYFSRLLLHTVPGSGPDAVVRAVLFLVFYSPVLWYGDSRTGILRRFKALGRRRKPARGSCDV